MTENKQYKHLFFDLDRTLWDLERNSESTLKELYIDYKLDSMVPRFDIFHDEFIRINENLWDLYRNGQISKSDLRAARFQETLKLFGLNDKELALELDDEYLARVVVKTYLFPGTLEVLDYLKGKYDLHIITNGFKEIQYTKMRHSQLDKFFQQVVTSDEAGASKPHKDIFHKALTAVNGKKSQSLMIGDDLATDIKGARNYGMDHVFCNFNRIVHQEQVTYEIYALSELTQLL